MVSPIKHHHLHNCSWVIAFTVLAFSYPIIKLVNVPVPFTSTALASIVSAGSEQIRRCDNDDYEYVRLTSETSGRLITNTGSRNLYLDARGTRWDHKHFSINILAYAQVCWDGGLIEGRNEASEIVRSRTTRLRRPSAMQITGHRNDVTIKIHRIGFLHVDNPIRIRGALEQVVIMDSLFLKGSGSCIEGLGRSSIAVENSLIEGCRLTTRGYVGGTAYDERQVLALRNNVIRVAARPMRTVNARNSKEQFDGSIRNIDIEMRSNIFLIESRDAYGLLTDMLGGNLTACSDNVVVWLGGGNSPSWLPDCFSVTNDASVWDEARAYWIREHQFVEQLDATFRESGEGGESPHHSDAESGVGSAGEAEAQGSLQPGSGRDAVRAQLGAVTLRTLAIPRRTRREEIGSPWSDQTLWNDGTGWADFSRESLVNCRESQGFRPMTGSTVCSP